jgi:hypothetical protein
MGDWNLYNSALEVHFSINIFSGAWPWKFKNQNVTKQLLSSVHDIWQKSEDIKCVIKNRISKSQCLFLLVFTMVLSDVLRCVLYNIVCPCCWIFSFCLLCWPLWPLYCLTFRYTVFNDTFDIFRLLSYDRGNGGLD